MKAVMEIYSSQTSNFKNILVSAEKTLVEFLKIIEPNESASILLSYALRQPKYIRELTYSTNTDGIGIIHIILW